MQWLIPLVLTHNQAMLSTGDDSLGLSSVASLDSEKKVIKRICIKGSRQLKKKIRSTEALPGPTSGGPPLIHHSGVYVYTPLVRMHTHFGCTSSVHTELLGVHNLFRLYNISGVYSYIHNGYVKIVNLGYIWVESQSETEASSDTVELKDGGCLNTLYYNPFHKTLPKSSPYNRGSIYRSSLQLPYLLWVWYG